jgi:hypothetical protein
VEEGLISNVDDAECATQVNVCPAPSEQNHVFDV